MCFSACSLDCATFESEEYNKFRIVRYDRLVEDFTATGNVALWQRMNTDFPLETRTLVENVLRIGRVDDDGIGDSLRIYYSDSTLCQVRADVTQQFDNMTHMERKLGRAFAKLSKEVPNFIVPKVYTQNSAFNESIIVGDSIIGVSLDKYLGSQYPPYGKYFYPNQRATMVPDRIVQDCLTFYLGQHFRPRHTEGMRPHLFDLMMHQGKLYWVVAQLTNSRLINVAAVQPATRQWYKNNERMVWNVLLERHLLSSTDSSLIHSVISSSDAHPYFSDPHSRGVGLWVGMRIVDNYMKRHPEVSLGQLLKDNNYEAMLRNADY